MGTQTAKGDAQLYFLCADLFCTLDEAADRGGIRGCLARVIRAWLTPAGTLLFGAEFMIDLDLRGRTVQRELEGRRFG
jgi:hypothetical protein